MMKIKEIKAKSIIVKSNLPDGDFVINPYVGCTHGCKYCYARFMKRFTGHAEPWGSFVDIKNNAPDLIPKGTNKYREKSIIISFVSPIFPQITDWGKIINETQSFVDEYWFENLNLYPSIKREIYRFLRKNKTELVEKYQKIYSKNSNYWNIEENKIKEFCKKNKVSYKIYFHHKRKDT